MPWRYIPTDEYDELSDAVKYALDETAVMGRMRRVLRRMASNVQSKALVRDLKCT